MHRFIYNIYKMEGDKNVLRACLRNVRLKEILGNFDL
jgi:hypothetical protein